MEKVPLRNKIQVYNIRYKIWHTLCNGFAGSSNYLPYKINILIPSKSTQAMNQDSKYLYINQISCLAHLLHSLEKPTLDQPFSINNASSLIIHISTTTGQNITIFLHIQYTSVFLCATIAQPLCSHVRGLHRA